MKKIALEEHFISQTHLDYLRARSGFPRLATVDDGRGNKVERLLRTPTSSQLYTAKRVTQLLDAGVRFIESVPICEADKAKICMRRRRNCWAYRPLNWRAARFKLPNSAAGEVRPVTLNSPVLFPPI